MGTTLNTYDKARLKIEKEGEHLKEKKRTSRQYTS